MIDNSMRWSVLLAAMIGLWRIEGLVAEPLPPRALARIGDHRFYHGPRITCVALSPDGRYAASAAREQNSDAIADNGVRLFDRLIVVWDAATGERLHELHVPQGTVSRLAFSPDGKRLVAAYAIAADQCEPKSGVVLFDMKAGTLLRRLRDFQAEISYLQFSADGKQLWVSEWRGPIRAWDAATGEQLHLWKPPPSKPASKDTAGTAALQGVLSPDSRYIAWEIGVSSLGGCPSFWKEGLRIHDAQTNILLYQKKFKKTDEEFSHDEFRWSFAFSSDSKRLVADCGDLEVWEAATGKVLATCKVPGMLCCALALDGRRAFTTEDKAGGTKSRFRLWDIETHKPIRELSPHLEKLGDRIHGGLPIFSSNGKLFMIATESTLRLFDARTGEERAAPGHRSPITPRFSADGRTLITTCIEKRCRWDVSGKKPSLLRHESKKAWEVDCLARSANGQLSLDCPTEDNSIRVCVRESATGRILKTLPEYALFADFSPDAARLLLYFQNFEGSYHIQLYDVQTGKKTGELPIVKKSGQPIFSPNGRLLAWVDCTGIVHLHDAATGKSVRTLCPSRPLPKSDKIETFFRILFSPDGEQLIIAGSFIDRSDSGCRELNRLPLRVFRVGSGREITRFYTNPEKRSRAAELSCMACSPDGHLLALAEKNSGIIRVLEIAGGKTRVEFTEHRHGVYGLAFSPDGQTLASGGEDNVVFLWDVTGAKTPAATPQPESAPTALWNDLASEDAKRAGTAIAALLRSPDRSVTFIQKRLHPAELIDDKRLTQWIADLDSDTYATREAASRDLFRSGERAEARLRFTVKHRPSLEVRKRIETLLLQLESGQLPLETLRIVRAIEVLEHIRSPTARRCLEALAKGASESRSTREARASLRRLANR